MRSRSLLLAVSMFLASPLALAHSLELLDESGNPLPTFDREGHAYVLGVAGQRFMLRVSNSSSRRIEVVASVDGRDVIDGKPSQLQKRGYIVDPGGQVLIDGFRLNREAIAAFRFSSVSQSYAAQMGDARDVGVVGVAIFNEHIPYMPPQPVYRESPNVEDLQQSRARRLNESEGAPKPSSSPPAKSNFSGVFAEKKADDRTGLGTEFGEEHASHVQLTTFTRASVHPATLLSTHYNDREGLRAIGIDVDHPGYVSNDAWQRANAQPFRRDPSYARPPPGWYGEQR